MIVIQKAIDPQTGERFSCVFDYRTCLPVEPIQRYINYCRRRQLAANTIFTYICRLVDFWHWLEYKSLNWQDVGLKAILNCLRNYGSYSNFWRQFMLPFATTYGSSDNNFPLNR